MPKFKITPLVLTLIAVCLSWNAQLEGQERVWTDKSGKYEQPGEFVEFKDGNVFLRVPAGNVIQIPLNALSEADQQFVAELTSPTEPEEMPAEQPPVEQPPVEQPPVEQPPVEQPSVEQPPVEQPKPPIETPPVETAPSTPLVSPPTGEARPRGLSDSTESPLYIETIEVVSIGAPAPLNEPSGIDAARLTELPAEFQNIGAAIQQRKNLVTVSQAVQQLTRKQSVPPLMIELITDMADSNHKTLRIQAIKLLARLDARNSLPKILEAIKDPSFDVRWTALELVEYLQDDRSIDALIAHFASDDWGKVTSILAKFGSKIEERAFPFLQSDNREAILNTIQLLEKVGTRKSIEQLQPLLSSSSITIRMQAKTSIAQLQKRLGN